MKFWLIAAATLIAAETAAIACSCMDTDDPVQLREFAALSAQKAVALVEVETILAYDESDGVGDRMRVVRLLAGSAAGEFRVQRGHFPSGASCDQLYAKGQRAVVLLYPATAAAAAVPTYRVSGLCTAHLLDKPLFRNEVARLLAKRAAGERG